MLLNHVVDGSGPPVLLLHAGIADLRMWAPQRPALAAEHIVVACDLRGYGETPLPPEPYADAHDVLLLLDHLGIDELALVGSSYGGYVATQLAANVPDRISRLVLLCAASDAVAPTDDVRAFAGQEDALLEVGDVEAATDLNVRTWLGPEADDAAVELVRTMQRRAFEVQLAAGEVESQALPTDLTQITAKTLVVSGAHDLERFGQIARHLSDGIADARHIELAWAGHLPSLERPDETTELILGALD
ncbi:MAG: alpha/beta fold hydrolase [Nocardioidaceae bacterium]